MGFLKFALLCIHSVAWPAFALVYPMVASIRAIETGTKEDMRKLVIYWTSFSLISMFELAFANIIQVIPFWSWIKLMLIFLLVIPQFEGACHAYQSLIHPCLCMNLQEYVHMLMKPKDERFLDVAEKYIQDNGSQALEKLIAGKEQLPYKESENVQRYSTVQEPEKISMAATSKLGSHTTEFINVARDEKETRAAAEVKEMTNPVTSAGEIPCLKEVQREWTCALCQVTTSSEKTLNAHLGGSKHRSNCESQIESKNNKRNVQSSHSTMDKSGRGKPNAENRKGGEARQKCSMKVEGRIKLTRDEQKQNAPPASPASKQRKLFCNVCNVKVCGEVDLLTHFKGKKHLLNVENSKKA